MREDQMGPPDGVVRLQRDEYGVEGLRDVADLTDVNGVDPGPVNFSSWAVTVKPSRFIVSTCSGQASINVTSFPALVR